MTKWKCKSCFGVYNDVYKDSFYYHECPPDTKSPRNENVIKDGADKGKIKSKGKGRVIA